MSVNKFGFARWNFQFELNGATTLDPEKDHNLLRRIAGRKKLFMAPLTQSGFLKGKRILDLGSNSGYWSYVALTEGGAEHVTGIEASPELVKQAEFVFKSKGIDQTSYDFLCQGAYSFFQNNSEVFDVIFCLGFFYHINDPILLLKLMHDSAKSYVVIDTVVHKSEDALISARPVPKKNLVDEGSITLELVSSRKAIFWMAEEVGFKETRLLKDNYERIGSMWDYIAEQRECFVLSNREPIEPVWSNAINPGFLSIQEDFKKYGYFPEMRKGGRNGA